MTPCCLQVHPVLVALVHPPADEAEQVVEAARGAASFAHAHALDARLKGLLCLLEAGRQLVHVTDRE